MTRFARHRPVVYVEEAVEAPAGEGPGVSRRRCERSGVLIATPSLPAGLDPAARDAALAPLYQRLLAEVGIARPALWYWTPMARRASRRLPAAAIVYDCMDELANFRFAPSDIAAREAELMAEADLVFTGGWSLYEAKRGRHGDVHPFPSSVDRAHFARARRDLPEPEDLRGLPRPRLGYYGVIDERLDLGLIDAAAAARPDWTFVMVGPLAKIAPDDLPRRPNIRWLGMKGYDALPSYLSAWDVALAPFAINESTRFISPTKTPEYLAGGRPVVATPVRDIVRHYGALAGVRIADGPEAFLGACEEALGLAAGPVSAWRDEADAALAALSWDETQARMSAHIERAARRRRAGARQTAPAVQPSRRRAHYDAVVVGAGFAGAVMAERIAADAGRRVLVLDRRDHIGGNAYDRPDAAGLLIHQYGPHIFHTNSAEIFAYLSRFTSWRPYEHRVLAQVRGQLVPIPINRTTLNMLYGAGLATDEEAAAFLAARAEPVETVRTSEDVVVSAVGRELYELFFRGYTRKQWGMDPSELDRSVTARVPTRTDADDRYFTDAFQAMPAQGYTRMFERMLDHRNIEVRTGVDWRDAQDVRCERLVYTGPIDEFFDFRHGRLPYRSLTFRHETLETPQLQPVATVNYPDEGTPWTRITEFKHLTGQTGTRTSIVREHPSAEGDPYYPIPRPDNHALYKRYASLAEARPDVTFIGRLATYRYYNMDQVVGQALAAYRRLGWSRSERPAPPARRAGAALRAGAA